MCKNIFLTYKLTVLLPSVKNYKDTTSKSNIEKVKVTFYCYFRDNRNKTLYIMKTIPDYVIILIANQKLHSGKNIKRLNKGNFLLFNIINYSLT